MKTAYQVIYKKSVLPAAQSYSTLLYILPILQIREGILSRMKCNFLPTNDDVINLI